MTQCRLRVNGGERLPKQTFFNLPEEKQETLIQAAKNEFSRVPLNEASIANIVKNAQIPRGSFYQYFEDKEDAFFYLLELGTIANKEMFISLLQKTEGDIAETFIELFKQMLIEFKDQENRSFFRNIFLNMNHKVERAFTEDMRLTEDFAEVRDVINMEKLNIAHEHEVMHVAKIIGMVTVQNLIQNFAKEIPYDEAVKNYEFEVNLLKRGLYNKEQN